MSLTDGSEDEGWKRGSPRTQDLCLSPSRLWEGTTPSHLEPEGSSQVTRDLGETQLAFSTAQFPQSSWVFPPLNTCPRFTFEVYILLCTTPITTSLMRSTGAKSWRGHPSLGQLRSVLPRSFQISGCSMSLCYNAPLCCRQG